MDAETESILNELRGLLNEHRDEIESLKGQVAGAVASADKNDGPLKRVFIAAQDGAGWTEKSVNAAGEIADFEDGRASTTAPVEIGNAFALMEIEGAVCKYVRIGDFVGYFAVTASSQDGSNKRYTYTMAQHEKTAAAYGGWTAKAGVDPITAYNDQEEDNSSSGLLGNGVNTTNLTGTLDLKPAPTAKGVHRVYAVRLTTGATEYWFSHVNAIDGGC
jgi:hypothetical protein